MSKELRSDGDAYDSAAYWEETAGYDYGDLNAAIDALDRDDPNYNDRYSTLIERLMCADMAMGPSRRSMTNREPPSEDSVSPEDERVERLQNFLRPFEIQDRETLGRWADKANALVAGQAETIAKLTEKPGHTEEPSEQAHEQTTKDKLLAHFKSLGFKKASSPDGGGCVITGFPPPGKASTEPPKSGMDH